MILLQVLAFVVICVAGGIAGFLGERVAGRQPPGEGDIRR
jgi:hypothetical protein